MDTSNSTRPNKLRLAVIHCLAHHGYRRAGIGFCKGENKFPAKDISETQLAQIEADPRLNVSFKDMDPQAEKVPLDERLLGDGGLGVTVGPEGNADKQAVKVLNFAEAIIQLEPDNKEHFTGDGKPQCDVLSKLMGEPISASERDSLWDDFKSTQVASQEAE